MPLFRKTKGITSKLIDIRVDKWIGLDHLKETTSHIRSILASVMVPPRARYSETFEEAMIRLNLTETDLAKRQHEFTRLLYFFVSLAFFVIVYALYLACVGSFFPALISFCLSFYCFTQAFRFHFWLFQIKHRKLGCSIREWFNSSVDPASLHEQIGFRGEIKEG